ncbi:hypothetical protein HI914_06024 [Erysiphe necator]|uniref:Early meiotic induction protein 1 n=1 Tax=Uncinula necator TaxID=52586 RepID=A0A0B1NZ81_UNCNE|nr:hypothetical protein HI914_06024 [Erysiphe necator]KHJ30310.1 hypothetical protein EV44_g5124 [Erysiphe necator]
MGWTWFSNETSNKKDNIKEKEVEKTSSDTKSLVPSLSTSVSSTFSSPSFENNDNAEREFGVLFSEASKKSIAEDELNQINSSTSADYQPKLESASNRTINTTFDHPKSISEQLLPTDMSCREAFDSAFYCNSLGGSFNHLYRYGTARSCNEHWSKFWFCMRIRTYDDESKKTSIKNFYREMEKKKYSERGTSSEDIWKSRDQLVKKGTAFLATEEEWNRTDEEWQNDALEMRKRIIEAAGSSKNIE